MSVYNPLSKRWIKQYGGTHLELMEKGILDQSGGMNKEQRKRTVPMDRKEAERRRHERAHARKKESALNWEYFRQLHWCESCQRWE